MQPYIDLHCDTLLQTVQLNVDDIYSVPEGMLDIERLKKADVIAQFFAIFFPDPHDALMAVQNTDEKYFTALRNTFCNTLEKHADVIAFAGSAKDMEKNRKEGKISAFLTFEDGRMLDGKIENVRKYYDLGIRLITLTWNFENCLGFPNSDDTTVMNSGLKPFGIEALKEMNRLGILIDVSHLSDGGFYDVARYSEKPFVASHSNARSICPHRRNLTDDMIRVLAEKGGVAGMNIAGHFLNPDITDDHSTVEMMVKHIRYMSDLGGEDLVAIGTDFDGIGGKLDIDEPTKMEQLFDALKKDGFTAAQIDKIAFGNAERVMREVL